MKFSKVYKLPTDYCGGCKYKIFDFDNINRITRDEINYIKSKKKEKSAFKKFVDNFDNLDRQKFMKQYVNLYALNFDNLLDAYIYNNIGKNTKTAEIMTDEIIEKHYVDDYAHFLSQGYYRVCYKVVCDKSLKIEDRIYTRKEIKSLCDLGKMFVLESSKDDNINCDLFSIPLGYLDDETVKNLETQQESDSVEIDVGLPEEFKNYDNLIALVNDENFDKFCEKNAKIIDMIKNEFTKEILTKDYKDYCKSYNILADKIVKHIVENNELVRSEMNKMIKKSEKFVKNTDSVIEELKSK